MKKFWTISLFAAAIAMLPANAADKKTPYEKLFEDCKVETVKSFLTVHLTDKNELIFELPANMLGRDMLVTSSVEQTSDGGISAVGFMSPKAVHVVFDATDSLILIKEVSAFRYTAADSLAQIALDRSHEGAVTAAFPIKAKSPSGDYVFEATDYFTEQDERLNPVDPLGAGSAGGLIYTELTRESSLSMLKNVVAFPGNVSIFGYETYRTTQGIGGFKSADEGKLTVLLRRSIILLPEKAMRPRIADKRIGVQSVSHVKYNTEDNKGAKRIGYADRWNTDSTLVFYVDTLFSPQVFDAIKKGIEKWNGAMTAAGHKDFIKVLPYPDDRGFDANDLNNSCVKFEATENEYVRHNIWVDPRSGEIMNATIYVPYNILATIHSSMYLTIGQADPSIRNLSNENPRIYEGLQAIITTKAGYCLGLSGNFAASRAIPLDSLRSASYTNKYGLSASVMDDVPYNFMAREGDGAKLVNTEPGRYDYYAIDWLYAAIPGTDTPEAEQEALKAKIRESRKDPMTTYIPSYYNSGLYGIDPRCVKGDLGDDELKSFPAMFDNLRNNIAMLDEWIGGQDPDYSFRITQNLPIVEASMFSLYDLLKNVGGFYLSENEEGDSEPTYVPVPRARQKATLDYALRFSDDLSWLNNRKLFRDIFFCRSIADYCKINFVIPTVLGAINKADFCASMSDDPYTISEVYEDIKSHLFSRIDYSKPMSDNEFFYLFYFTSMPIAHAMTDGNKQLLNTPAVSFAQPRKVDHIMFMKLEELRKDLKKAGHRASDKALRLQFQYLEMAVHEALRTDR